MSTKSDGTLSVKEAYELWAHIYGPRAVTDFYLWRKKHQVPTAPGSTRSRPRYWPNDILRTSGVTSEPVSDEDMYRHAQEAADYAARGLKWPPT